MSDSLFMPLAQRAAGRRELVGWEAVWMPLGEGEAERLTIGIGSGWKPIEVPRQLAAQEGRQSVWYRTEFPRPDHAGRVVLRIGGAFLATNVWLNGRLLGYSPLSRVVELEGLVIGVYAKMALWRSLQQLEPERLASAGASLSDLIERAERQLEELERHRKRAMSEVFVSG